MREPNHPILADPCFDIAVEKPARGEVQRHNALDFSAMMAFLIVPMGPMLNRPDQHVRVTVRRYGRTVVRMEINAPDDAAGVVSTIREGKGGRRNG